MCRQVRITTDAEYPEHTWIDFLKANCAALFQSALLLTADPEAAEASVAATLESIDVSRPPEAGELASLQKAVAMLGIRESACDSFVEVGRVQAMIQAGLWPVLQVERSPRACFVLRILLGCATSCCAQALGIDEAGVTNLLRLGILQLRESLVGSNSGGAEPAELSLCGRVDLVSGNFLQDLH